MTTPELVNYLKKQIEKKIPKDIVITKLKSVGWKEKDIEEGFSEAFGPEENKEQIQNDNLNESKTDLSLEQTDQKKPFFSRPKTRINSNLLYTPTIPSVNTQINQTQADNKELIPRLIPKGNIYNFNQPTPQKEIPNTEKAQNTGGFFTEEINSQKMREEAMLSSFPKDFMKENSVVSANKNIFNRIFSKKIILTLIIIFLIVGFYLVYKSGYIKLPQINNFSLNNLVSLINNSSKKIFSNSPDLLSSILSYKTDTKIIITAPAKISSNSMIIDNGSLSNIESKTSIHIKSEVNQKGLSTQSSNGLFTIQSNSLMGNFVTNIKSNGSVLFVPLSDLNQFVVNKMPQDGFIAINENEYNQIKNIIANNFQESVKSVNIHKLLIENLSGYLDRIIIRAYGDYISNLEIEGEKGEKILGIDTYKYNISNNPILANKFFSETSKVFAIDSLAEDRMNKTANLIKVDSFKIWVDQKNQNLFKFNIVFSIPMTELAKENDIYPPDSYASFDWQTTYYDLNIINKIEMPEKIISVEDFIKNTEQTEEVINTESIIPETE